MLRKLNMRLYSYDIVLKISELRQERYIEQFSHAFDDPSFRGRNQGAHFIADIPFKTTNIFLKYVPQHRNVLFVEHNKYINE